MTNENPQTSSSSPTAVPTEIQGKTLQGGALVEDLAAAAPARNSSTAKYSPEHRGFATSTHDYLRQFIILADQKAAFFFAAGTAMLGFLETRPKSHGWLSNPTSWSGWDAVTCISFLGLVLGSASCILVVLPRLGGDATGLIYWRAIAQIPQSTDYARRVLGASENDLLEETLHHSHELAKICTRSTEGSLLPSGSLAPGCCRPSSWWLSDEDGRGLLLPRHSSCRTSRPLYSLDCSQLNASIVIALEDTLNDGRIIAIPIVGGLESRLSNGCVSPASTADG